MLFNYTRHLRLYPDLINALAWPAMRVRLLGGITHHTFFLLFSFSCARLQELAGGGVIDAVFFFLFLISIISNFSANGDPHSVSNPPGTMSCAAIRENHQNRQPDKGGKNINNLYPVPAAPPFRVSDPSSYIPTPQKVVGI